MCCVGAREKAIHKRNFMYVENRAKFPCNGDFGARNPAWGALRANIAVEDYVKCFMARNLPDGDRVR